MALQWETEQVIHIYQGNYSHDNSTSLDLVQQCWVFLDILDRDDVATVLIPLQPPFSNLNLNTRSTREQKRANNHGDKRGRAQ